MVRQIKHSTIEISLLAISFLMMLVLNISLNRISNHWEELPQESAQRMSPSLFRMLSFGHLPIAIDWAFLLSLTDDSMSKVKAGEHPKLYYTLDLIADLDPLMFEVFQGGANLLSVVRGDSVGARDLLLKGCRFIKTELPSYSEDFRKKYWSQSWNLYMILAFVYLFQLDDMPNAADAFLESAALPNAPDFILRLEKRLRRPGGEYEVGLKLLNFYIEGAKDVRVKKELEKKRLNLFISHYVFEINESFRNFLNAQPKYRDKDRLSIDQMNSYWKTFLRSSRISSTDPWGGKLRLDQNGQAITTTPHSSVFGLR